MHSYTVLIRRRAALAAAAALARAGHRVAVADLDGVAACRTAEALAAEGAVAIGLTCDVTSTEAVDDTVLRLVGARGGSISAEHGIGTAKKRWLHLARSEAEVAAFRALKHALDPAGILNPNALLP